MNRCESQLPEGSQSHFNGFVVTFDSRQNLSQSQLPEGSQSHFNLDRRSNSQHPVFRPSQLPEGSQSHFNLPCAIQIFAWAVSSQLPEGSQSHFNVASSVQNLLRIPSVTITRRLSVPFQRWYLSLYSSSQSVTITRRLSVPFQPLFCFPSSPSPGNWRHNYPKALSPISTVISRL